MEVKKGDSVTLDPGLTKPFNHIMWWFGVSIIAETDGNEASYTKDERFRGRLKLDDETGSLTIKNTRITDSGVYKAQIDHSAGTSTVTFSVTVDGSFYPDPGSFDPDPGLSLGAVAAIVVAPLVVSAAAAAVSAAISYCRKISERRRQNDKEKRKSTDSGQSDQ